MVVEFLRRQGRARHEAESRVEIGKREPLDDRIAAFDLGPALETGKRASAGVAGKLLRHVKPR